MAATIQSILAAWPIAGPWTVLRDIRSSNNLSWRVAAPSGEFVLRVYQNTSDRERILFEHAVLARLNALGLSFQVPEAFPTLAVESLAPASVEGTDGLAALFPVIPGEHPSYGDLDDIRLCGAALAELDEALALVDLPSPQGLMPPYNLLTTIHPAVPDPLTMLRDVPLDPGEREESERRIRRIAALVPEIYGDRPLQLVHHDFDPSNILVAGGRVTGILDFEFVGPDLRVSDLATAMCQLARNGSRAPLTFLGAYHERSPLEAWEVEALPDVMRLTRVVSLIHRVGRYRRGQAPIEAVRGRVENLFRVDEWLEKYGRLIGRPAGRPAS